MKKYTIFILIFLISLVSKGQTSIALTLNAGDEDAAIDDYHPTQNNPNEIEYNQAGWTISGVPVSWRSVFRFNLSSIPSGAIVQSARLSLYYANPNTYGNAPQQSLTHSNECVVRRITSSWTESTVNWNNQPSTTSQDELSLAQSTDSAQDYLNLDVTAMVQEMVNSVNNGFMIQMIDESPYARMIFASGDHPDSTKHPVLEITYMDLTCITFFLGPAAEDAAIDDYYPAQNRPNEPEYNLAGWSISGTPVIWRNLFKFDFSSIPGNAVIQSANLNLYYPPINTYGNAPQQSLTHSNVSIIQRVTGPWSENSVNWYNQPPVTTTDEVTLPQSTDSSQDYLNIDLKPMVQQMLNSSNNGFLIRMVDETPYARMIFASGDYSDNSKRPSLEVCYSVPNGINSEPVKPFFTIYPNPSNGLFEIMLSKPCEIIEVYNALGQKVYVDRIDASVSHWSLDLSELPGGIYFLNLSSASQTYCQKLMIR